MGRFNFFYKNPDRLSLTRLVARDVVKSNDAGPTFWRILRGFMDYRHLLELAFGPMHSGRTFDSSCSH